MHSLDSFFATVKLPSISEVAHPLIQTLNREDVAAAEIRDPIGKDPALSAMLLRLGELLLGQADPGSLAHLEKLPQPPGSRWKREKRLIGFSEGQITTELARRWNFPMQMVQALERSIPPLAGVLKP